MAISLPSCETPRYRGFRGETLKQAVSSETECLSEIEQLRHLETHSIAAGVSQTSPPLAKPLISKHLDYLAQVSPLQLQHDNTEKEANVILSLKQTPTLNRLMLNTITLYQDLHLAFRMSVVMLKIAKPTLLKRSLDIIVSATLLVLLAPLFLLLACLIKADGGPVFYSQMRIGQGGRMFRFWKFRSMVVNADQLRAELQCQNQMQGGVLFKMKRDPRITTIGRLLRRTSLDELPQLWNVLRGDMSLVGPRPALPQEVLNYDSRACRRLEVPQGITCLWQIQGRNLIPFAGQVALDLDYAQKQRFVQDIKILASTIPAVVTGKGAY